MNAITTTQTVVRVSALPNYSDCPRRSATTLFRRDIQLAGYDLRTLPNGIGAVVGTSVHAGAALMLKEKASAGLLAPLDVATDAAIETCREKAAEGVEYDTKTTSSLGEAEEQVVRMVRSYRNEVAPNIDPILVEERLEAEVPNTTQKIILSGQSDVVAREPGKIRDLKGGSKLGTYTGQVGGYSLLAKTGGIDIQGAAIDFVPRVRITNRTKTRAQPPAIVQNYRLELAETAAINILRQIDTNLKTFREGDSERGLSPGDPWSFPANPNSMLCGAKYCACYGCDGETSFCHEWVPKEQPDE